jgi:predicted secreted protein
MPIAAITPKHGKNSLVYINASEISGANAWSLEIEHDIAELSAFGDDWRRILAGLRSWGGSIDAWHDQASKVLHTAVTADTVLPILIYPDDTDITTYISGNALFASNEREGSMDGAITSATEFTGDGVVTFPGWS